MQAWTRRCAWMLAILALAPSGCAQMRALSHADHLERRGRVERLEFAEAMRDAYFILGYEYYTLAREAEERGEQDRAADYATRARLYNLYYRELRDSARRLRRSLEAQGTGDLPRETSPDAAGPSSPSAGPIL